MTWHDIIRLHVARPQTRRSVAAVPLRWDEVPESLKSLARGMKVALDESTPVEIAPDWLGAQAMVAAGTRQGKRIRLGGLLGERLSSEAIEGVIAHELAHLRCMHWELLLAGSSLAALAGVALGLAIDVPIAIKLLLGSVVLMGGIGVVSWQCEYEADSVAAEYVGCETMAATLRELRDSGFRTRGELTHPSDRSRINRLSGACRR